METNKLKLPVLLIMINLLTNSTESFATVFNVSAGSNYFSPQNINVTVGDTVKWRWVFGTHSTTCNDTYGSRPSGASPWNANLSAASQTFVYVVTVAGLYRYVCIYHPSMTGTINAVTSSISQLTEIVNGYELSQNYPNPFNPETNIKFSVPNSSIVTLKIYNNNGQEVQTLVNEKLNAGSYKVYWNAANFNSGVYYYKIQTGEFIQTRKMLLIK